MPASPRQLQLIDQVLDGAALRGERILGVTRLVLVPLFLVQMLIFEGWRGIGLARVDVLLSCCGYLVGIGFSIYVLTTPHLAERLRWHRYASVVVDALIIAGAALPFYVWPAESYAGFLRTGELGIVTVAIVATGFRLSPPAVLVGAAAQLAVQLAGFAIDLTRNLDRVTWGAEQVVVWALCIVGATLIAHAGARWTRALVTRGARAAVAEERARQRLGLYVSEEVAREALDVSSIEIGGRRQEVTVLFSDIRGFTSYSEKTSPEQVVLELNAYLNAMVCAIREHGGVVDKFVGDAIMVVFGIPDSRPDDALRALRTARAMQSALGAHNEARARADRPPLAHGIGVHTGPAIAGNIGNADRIQYTVIGDVVNLASRLESATKELGLPIVVSSAAVEAAEAAGGDDLPSTRGLGPIRVKGRDAEIEVFTVAPRPSA